MYELMQLAPMAIGRIDIQYRRVECVPPAPMVVFVDNNNGPGSWLRLFIGTQSLQIGIPRAEARASIVIVIDSFEAVAG